MRRDANLKQNNSTDLRNLPERMTGNTRDTVAAKPWTSIPATPPQPYISLTSNAPRSATPPLTCMAAERMAQGENIVLWALTGPW
ncbi:hypothetical protein Pcar_3237 [Syntrophotalea carbinolica DSM 2380]|uniref:Uncharacterized protein n=1 Tax=Syntrophotalea carbinolica (strain DSM 2380 / NBRC 103641 / GraBd1) TaxID=338963 RepID=Q0C6T0_SYNC1|nr:hypothetical protein Pcar_3237 [Syntrophotalea carbinolica DSM 2380]